jgi:hypothetical protein
LVEGVSQVAGNDVDVTEEACDCMGLTGSEYSDRNSGRAEQSAHRLDGELEFHLGFFGLGFVL